MKKLLAITILLSGCAVSPEQLREIASKATVDGLCLGIATKPQYQEIFQAELESRKAQCDWEKVKIMIQAQQLEQQRLMNALMLMNSMKPAAPLQTNCTTFGNTMNCQTR